MNKVFKRIKISNPSSFMSCFARAQLGKVSMLGEVGAPQQLNPGGFFQGLGNNDVPLTFVQRRLEI